MMGVFWFWLCFCLGGTPVWCGEWLQGGQKLLDTTTGELMRTRQSLRQSSLLATEDMRVSSPSNSDASVLEDPPLAVDGAATSQQVRW